VKGIQSGSEGAKGQRAKIQSIPETAWQLPDHPQGSRKLNKQFGYLLPNTEMKELKA